MPEVETENVLVVPAALLHELGYFQGFTADMARYLDSLLHSSQASYRPRGQMEDDPDFKQLIPYVVFRHVDSDGRTTVFQYTRGTGQGEGRLHRKRSIGVGGHISSDDLREDGSGNPYEEGLRRELDEEVEIRTTHDTRCVGLINDDETAVGRVHLGVVHVCDVAEAEVYSRESEIVDAGFRPIEELFAQIDQFETWSQICLRALFEDPGQGNA